MLGVLTDDRSTRPDKGEGEVGRLVLGDEGAVNVSRDFTRLIRTPRNDLDRCRGGMAGRPGEGGGGGGSGRCNGWTAGAAGAVGGTVRTMADEGEAPKTSAVALPGGLGKPARLTNSTPSSTPTESSDAEREMAAADDVSTGVGNRGTESALRLGARGWAGGVVDASIAVAASTPTSCTSVSSAPIRPSPRPPINVDGRPTAAPRGGEGVSETRRAVIGTDDDGPPKPAGASNVAAESVNGERSVGPSSVVVVVAGCGDVSSATISDRKRTSVAAVDLTSGRPKSNEANGLRAGADATGAVSSAVAPWAIALENRRSIWLASARASGDGMAQASANRRNHVKRTGRWRVVIEESKWVKGCGSSVRPSARGSERTVW